MKKIKLFLLMIIIMLPVASSALTIQDDSSISPSSGINSGCKDSSCWTQFQAYGGTSIYQAIRITFYHKSGKKISNSVDFTNGYIYKDKNFYSVPVKKSKIDYIKNNDKGNFTFTLAQGANIHKLEFSNFLSTAIKVKDLSDLLSKYINKQNLPDITSEFSFCKGDYQCDDVDKKNYYAVVEPATMVKLDGKYYYGTYYELKWLYASRPFNNGTTISTSKPNKYWWAATTVTSYMPKSIIIRAEAEFTPFYNAVGLNYNNKNAKNLKSISNNNDIFGIGVLKAESLIGDIPRRVVDQTISKTEYCPVDVEINNCGNPSIKEPNNKSCLVNNSLYLYNSSCNLYCSETITTQFQEFYNTFKNSNVKYNAIPGGRFIPINDSPKITITKTCYQSTGTAECPNWKSSLEKQVKNEYNKRSEIILNVDEHSYTLFGEFLEDNFKQLENSNDKVTYQITYEHKMDPNINKYISIETGKDVGTNLEKYEDQIITFNNQNGTIITKKTSFGTYTYSLNINSTKLNKYMNGSNNLTKLVSTSYTNKVTNSVGNVIYNTTYNYTFNNTINTNYSSNDLLFNCSYVKANPCICPINTVCDSLTCEPVKNPPCECNSECGCKDNKTCDPIPCPNKDDDLEVCDPERETCFPNVVYRPISLVNPFPGIDGGGRLPGNNWNGVVRDNDGNLIYYNGSILSLSDYYIRYNRGYNDYEIYQTKPLYTIRLDADTINYIRDYNDAVRKKSNSDYNDFDFTCENGEKCISNFLRGTSKIAGYNRNLLDSERSECYRSNSFDSCIKRKGA